MTIRQIERDGSGKTPAARGRTGPAGKRPASRNGQTRDLTDAEWSQAQGVALDRLLAGLDSPEGHLAYIRGRVSEIL